MPFVPDTLELHEAGADAPYQWSLCQDLTWTGTFRGGLGRLVVSASPEEPFLTDLASVPRFMTWLFPRYGKYTKAAVLHDYLCRNFGRATIACAPGAGCAPASWADIQLKDRSDADEVFRHVMGELGVPWPRRWLMWAAVTCATLFQALWTGRQSQPVLRQVGRVITASAFVAVVWVVMATLSTAGSPAPEALVSGAVALLGGFLLGGYVAQGRWDRWLVYLSTLGIGVAALPFLVAGAAVGALTAGYLVAEEALTGFPWVRRALAGKPPVKLGLPRAERRAAVHAS